MRKGLICDEETVEVTICVYLIANTHSVYPHEDIRLVLILRPAGRQVVATEEVSGEFVS
jgi:hypothetical protein